MKSGFKFSAILGACTIFTSFLAKHASANWEPVNNFTAHGVIARGSTVYALTDTWVPGAGWLIQTYNHNYPNNGWQNMQQNPAATYLTEASGGNLYAITVNDVVWQTQGSGWVSLSTANCEGGSIVPRQLPNHNNLATSTTGQWLITVFGQVRSYTGSCWQLLPALPAGIANDIAINSVNYGQLPWVASPSGDIFRWNGTTWIAVPGGFAAGLNNNKLALASDSKSVWSFDGTTFFKQTDWPSGTVILLGSTDSQGFVGDVRRVALTIDGRILADE